MSWNPLKKLGLSSAPGSSGKELAEKEDFERCLAKLTAAEGSTKKLTKDAKKLSESILSLNRFDLKLTNDLSKSALCQHFEPELRLITEEWHTFNSQLTQHSEDFATNLQKIVIDPLKRLSAAFGEIRVAIKKRDQSLQEIAKCSQKLGKLNEKEKTGPNLVKQEQTRQALVSIQEEFNQQNQLLLQEVPLFIDSRIDYFQPSLEGFIRSEALFWGDSLQSLDSFSQLAAIQSDSGANASQWRDYELKQSQLLSQISQLSIVEGTA